MILSRIKINGSRLLAETGIDLTTGDTYNLKGIKLNGNIVIDFRSYDECGPGPVYVSEIPSGTKCRLLIISDTYSRLDADCSGDGTESSPYIPYRGIAGIMRAAIFRGDSEDPFSIATDLAYEENPYFANRPSLQQEGTFGYPWSDNPDYPGPINSGQYSSSDEPHVNMAKLLYPSTYAGNYAAPGNWIGPEMLAISNYYSGEDVNADLFTLDDGSGGDGGYRGIIEPPPSSYYPEWNHTPILFDQDHLVAGSFGIGAWGTGPDNTPGSYKDSLRIVTYDDARLWYLAGVSFANKSNASGIPPTGIAFIGCTREQIGSFLQGANDTDFDVDALLSTNKIKSTGFIDMQGYDLNNFNTGFETLLQSVLGVPSGSPETWEFGGAWASEQAFAIVTGIGPGSNSKFIDQFQPFIIGLGSEGWTFAQQLWHTIANTPNCQGWLVSGYPSLFSYSYMGFNGEYNLLGPISPGLDPFDKDYASINGSASDWPTRLHEVFVDPTGLFKYMSDPDNSDLFQMYKGVLAEVRGITMDPNAELDDSLDFSSNGSFDSIIGNNDFESEYQVLFSKRVLNFTVDIDQI